MIVRNILPRALERLAVIEADAPVREAAALMSKPHTDLVVVCDHGDMVGVVRKTDIVGQIGRCMGAGCTARVDSIMIRDVTYCRTQEILLDVWSVMRERGLQRVPILDEARRPLGILYAREALQALLSEVENEDELLRDYISGVGYRQLRQATIVISDGASPTHRLEVNSRWSNLTILLFLSRLNALLRTFGNAPAEKHGRHSRRDTKGPILSDKKSVALSRDASQFTKEKCL